MQLLCGPCCLSTNSPETEGSRSRSLFSHIRRQGCWANGTLLSISTGTTRGGTSSTLPVEETGGVETEVPSAPLFVGMEEGEPALTLFGRTPPTLLVRLGSVCLCIHWSRLQGLPSAQLLLIFTVLSTNSHPQHLLSQFLAQSSESPPPFMTSQILPALAVRCRSCCGVMCMKENVSISKKNAQQNPPKDPTA